jgi:hypothetical protein
VRSCTSFGPISAQRGGFSGSWRHTVRVTRRLTRRASECAQRDGQLANAHAVASSMSCQLVRYMLLHAGADRWQGGRDCGPLTCDKTSEGQSFSSDSAVQPRDTIYRASIQHRDPLDRNLFGCLVTSHQSRWTSTTRTPARKSTFT